MRRSLPLFVVLWLSASLKLAAFVTTISEDPSRFLAPDTSGYHDTARALLASGSFSVSPEHATVPDTIRTPGFPAFLAAVYFFLGEDPAIVVGVQIVLSLLTIVLVHGLASRLWTPRVGLVAASFLALDPASYTFTLLVLTETLFTLLVTVGLVAIERLVGNGDARIARRLGAASVLGLALTLATLVRPLSYYLPAVLLPFLLLVGLRGLAWRWRVAACACVLVPLLIGVGGWQLRNWRATGDPALSQIEGLNFLFFRAAGVVALRDGVSIDDAGLQIGGDRDSLTKQAQLHPELQLGAHWRRQGLAILAQHPWLALEVQVRGLLDLLLRGGDDRLLEVLGVAVPDARPLRDLTRIPASEWRERWISDHPVVVLALIGASGYLMLVYLGVLRFGVDVIRGRDRCCVHLVIALIALYLVVISAGPEAHSRFRVPVMPILCMYAAAGWLRADGRAGG
jgi:4-amino-4-deoxy-L-arabinose transferase-like glycosyltransferase